MAVPKKKTPARRKKAPKPPTCLLCGKLADAKSTHFTVGNSDPILHACEAHAPVIRQGVASTAKLAAVGVRTLINIRFPGLLDTLTHLSAAVRSATTPQD